MLQANPSAISTWHAQFCQYYTFLQDPYTVFLDFCCFRWHGDLYCRSERKLFPYFGMNRPRYLYAFYDYLFFSASATSYGLTATELCSAGFSDALRNLFRLSLKRYIYTGTVTWIKLWANKHLTQNFRTKSLLSTAGYEDFVVLWFAASRRRDNVIWTCFLGLIKSEWLQQIVQNVHEVYWVRDDFITLLPH